MALKDDLGLNPTLGDPNVQVAWTGRPGARLGMNIAAEQAKQRARGVVQALAGFHEGVRAVLGQKAAENEQLQAQRDTQAGRVAGMNIQNANEVAGGAKQPTDNPAFMRGYAQGHVEVSQEKIHNAMVQGYTPGMPPDQIAAIGKQAYEAEVGDPAKADPLYAGPLGASVTRMVGEFQAHAADVNRKQWAQAASLDLGENVGNATVAWLQAGKPGGPEALAARLADLDQHAFENGTVPATQRVAVYSKVLGSLVDATGDHDLAQLNGLRVKTAASKENPAGYVTLGNVNGNHLANILDTANRAAASAAREERAAAREARTEAKDKAASDFYTALSNNPEADIPDELQSRLIQTGNGALLFNRPALEDKALSDRETANPEIVHKLAAAINAGEAGPADILGLPLSKKTRSDMMRLALAAEKNGGVYNKPEVQSAVKSFADSVPKPPDAIVKGDANDIASKRAHQEILAQGRAAIQNFNASLDPSMSPADRTKALKPVIDEQMNLAKARAETVYSHGAGFSPDMQRDAAAAHNLPSSAFDVYFSYRADAAAAGKISSRAVKAAVTALQLPGAPRTPEMEAHWRAHQNATGSVSSYEDYVLGTAQYLVPVSKPAKASSAIAVQ